MICILFLLYREIECQIISPDFLELNAEILSLFLCFLAQAETNTRIRTQGATMRNQKAEPNIRTISRTRTEQSTPGDRHRVYFYFIFSILIFSEML